MHLPEIDKFAHLDSPFHSWDPRIKIVSILFLIIVVVLTNDIPSALLGLALAVGMVCLSRIPFRFVLVHLKWVLMIALFFFIVMPLTVNGGGIIRLCFVSLSTRGIWLASLISIKAVSAVLLIFPMVGTARFDLTLKALESLKVPCKLVQMLMFTYRYIFVFMDELRRMLTAASARGFKKGASPGSLRIVSNLIGMLFVRSYERTERVYNAMVSRGYDGTIKTLDEFSVCGKDFGKAFLLAAAAVTVIFAASDFQ